MTTTPKAASTAELKQLADQHMPILRQSALSTGFKSMPAGGPAAIDAGLVIERDPTWMFSDDPRVRNGFSMTELGQQAAQHLGWICRCSGCARIHAQMGWTPAVAVQDFCPRCDSSRRSFGTTRFDGRDCCREHRRILEDDGTAPPLLRATDDELRTLAGQHATVMATAISKQELNEAPKGFIAAFDDGMVTMRPNGLAGMDQDSIWINLTKEGEKAARAMGWECRSGEDDSTDSACPQHGTPERCPITWRWHKTAHLGWVASSNVANPTPGELPHPGDEIIVLRKHGGKSAHTVREIRSTRPFADKSYPIALVVTDEASDTAMTAHEAESAPWPAPVRYVRTDTTPEKSWVKPTPANKPIHWSWRRRARTWVATGSRPLREDEIPPAAGQVISIRRRNMTWSQHPVTAYVGNTRDGFPQLTVGHSIP